MTENEKIIRVGSRKSELALIQTKHVITRLQKIHPEIKFEIHTMSTIGDRVLNISLPKIGEKSLFTRDLEDALRNGGVDFVVHSLKDLPTALPPGMAIGAILEREDSRDALVLNEKLRGQTIQTLPEGSIIGTSSLRRTAQLRRMYPHLEVCDIRGNLNTRLAKLDAPASKFAGIILAQAGLLRMGWITRISQVLEPVDLLYAVGQGALAVECRSNDFDILQMLQKLMCLPTTCRILAERSFLKTLGGGCSAPVAVCTNLKGKFQNQYKKYCTKGASIKFTGAVWSLDGQTEIRDEIDCCLDMEQHKLFEEFNSSASTNSTNNNIMELVDDVSPRKRAKQNEYHTIETPMIEKKRKSPIVFNDDNFPEIQLTNSTVADSLLETKNLPIDLKKLIDVHGELFKKCPFFAVHQKDRENGCSSSSMKKEECPLNLPVGQDFMGKCPYVDTDQKVQLSEPTDECTVTKNVAEKLMENKHGQIRIDKKEKNAKLLEYPELGCPYSNMDMKDKKITSGTTELGMVLPNSFESSQLIGHDSCPFLQKTIKMIDYEDDEKPKMMQIPPILLNNCQELYCGVYRHRCYARDLFAKCDELGQKLADILIQKGALHVMKQAQDEIHCKI